MQQDTVSVQGRQEMFKKFCEEAAAVLLGKGHDYTAGNADADAYYNFRAIADLLKGAPITPYTVALIYGLKHVFSIITFAKTGQQEGGEDIHSRHIDNGNYNFILNELAFEHLRFMEKRHLDVDNCNMVGADRKGRPEVTTIFHRRPLATILDDYKEQGCAEIPYSASLITPERLRVVEDILSERKRQIEVEGYTKEHDDRHSIAEWQEIIGKYRSQPLLRENWRKRLVMIAAACVAAIEAWDRRVGVEKNLAERMKGGL